MLRRASSHLSKNPPSVCAHPRLRADSSSPPRRFLRQERSPHPRCSLLITFHSETPALLLGREFALACAVCGLSPPSRPPRSFPRGGPSTCGDSSPALNKISLRALANAPEECVLQHTYMKYPEEADAPRRVSAGCGAGVRDGLGWIRYRGSQWSKLDCSDSCTALNELYAFHFTVCEIELNKTVKITSLTSCGLPQRVTSQSNLR